MKEEKINNFFWGNEFSEKISICYISSLYQGFFFFSFGFCDIVIGNHPQEGLISVMSNRNWYMGIFWNSSYGPQRQFQK